MARITHVAWLRLLNTLGARCVFYNCIRATMFTLRVVWGSGKEEFNKKHIWVGNCQWEKKRLCMHKGVWTVKCRRGSTVKVCVCVCVCAHVRVSVCGTLSQSFSWAAAASRWLFSLQRRSAGTWVFISVFLFKRIKKDKRNKLMSLCVVFRHLKIFCCL